MKGHPHTPKNSNTKAYKTVPKMDKICATNVCTGALKNGVFLVKCRPKDTLNKGFSCSADGYP